MTKKSIKKDMEKQLTTYLLTSKKKEGREKMNKEAKQKKENELNRLNAFLQWYLRDQLKRVNVNEKDIDRFIDDLKTSIFIYHSQFILKEACLLTSKKKEGR